MTPREEYRNEWATFVSGLNRNDAEALYAALVGHLASLPPRHERVEGMGESSGGDQRYQRGGSVRPNQRGNPSAVKKAATKEKR